jgi:riboflavin biosynthesis pyrimidine reductase
VLVGAATLRAEGYERIGGSADRRERRQRKHLAPVPRLAVATATGDLPTDHPLLGAREHPALVVTHAGALERVREGLERRGYLGTVDLVVAGEHDLDATRLRRSLRDRHLTRVVCEGGPTLAGLLVDQDAVDEVFVTVSPNLVGGRSARLLAGAEERLRGLRLVWCEATGDEVLLRYERVRR